MRIIMSYFDFKDLPLNFKRSYTMEVDKSGCEVYIPIDSKEPEVISACKKALNSFLKNQPEPVQILA